MAGQRRLRKEYAELAKHPPPYILARPYESNLFETHFIMRGPHDSPYEGGEYYGVLVFPPSYPFAPPSIKMYTPSGRFQPNKKICTSMSDFHPSSWNPSWSISTILTGLLSFMLDSEITTGAIRTFDAEKRQLATASHAFNMCVLSLLFFLIALALAHCVTFSTQTKFRQVFPEYAGPNMVDLPNMGEPPKRKLTTRPEREQTATGSSPAQALPPNLGKQSPFRLCSFLMVAGVCVVTSAVLIRLVS